jgi:glucosyl-dolichyl phosphate glucuronosyltransferase
MDIAVVLCTYNRCHRLAEALESVAASQLPDSVSWEVLVVDNNSKDKTREVVEDFDRRYPGRFRYEFESRQGKSHALNSAIHKANADILAFMDDDVQVDSNWLCSLTSVLNDRKWSGSGGRILPEASFAPPRWLETKTRYALAPLAIFDLGAEPGELHEAPFGTNMAFRAEMFSKYGGFRTDLGPQPGSEIRSEDTEFGARLLAGGERFWYEPSAVVYHPTQQERIRPAYFLAWWFDKARADIREHGVPQDTKWHINGIPLYLLGRFCAWSLRWLFTLDPGRRFSCKLKVWSIAGMIEECRRSSMTRTQLPDGARQ